MNFLFFFFLIIFLLLLLMMMMLKYQVIGLKTLILGFAGGIPVISFDLFLYSLYFL